MNFLVKVGYIFRELRWNQWYKGFFTFFALLWVPHLWQQQFSLVFAGAITFNIASSIVYLINDLRDIEQDRIHPEKKNRPLASGKLSPWEIYALLVLLCGALMMLTVIIPSSDLALLLLVYLVANFAYSYWLKQLPYVDIMLVATFACFRVVGGFVLLEIPIVWYFVSVVFTLGIFVTSMQRLAEISLGIVNTRSTLRYYSSSVLKLIMTVFMIMTVFLYYVASSLVAPPLIYTDVLYFLVLLSMQQYMMVSKTRKSVAWSGFVFLSNHKLTLVLLVLLLASIAAIGILYF
ncbi:UbiA family prenyltransferase [bacterium]|nr:UbiA family prenyltransferase [bacterium]